MQGVLGVDAAVKSRIHEIEIEINDQRITKEEVCEAVIQQIVEVKGMTPDSIKSLRKAYINTLIAVVRLPAEMAKKAVEFEKTQVG